MPKRDIYIYIYIAFGPAQMGNWRQHVDHNVLQSRVRHSRLSSSYVLARLVPSACETS